MKWELTICPMCEFWCEAGRECPTLISALKTNPLKFGAKIEPKYIYSTELHRTQNKKYRTAVGSLRETYLGWSRWQVGLPVELAEKPDNEGCHRKRQNMCRVVNQFNHDPPAAGHGHLKPLPTATKCSG